MPICCINIELQINDVAIMSPIINRMSYKHSNIGNYIYYLVFLNRMKMNKYTIGVPSKFRSRQNDVDQLQKFYEIRKKSKT